MILFHSFSISNFSCAIWMLITSCTYHLNTGPENSVCCCLEQSGKVIWPAERCSTEIKTGQGLTLTNWCSYNVTLVSPLKSKQHNEHFILWSLSSEDKKGQQIAPPRCLAGEITCWVSQWETTEEKETKKHTLSKSKIWEIRKRINYFKNERKNKREQEESMAIKKTTKIIRKKSECHIGRRSHLFAQGAVLPILPLQELGKEGRGEHSTSHDAE